MPIERLRLLSNHKRVRHERETFGELDGKVDWDSGEQFADTLHGGFAGGRHRRCRFGPVEEVHQPQRGPQAEHDERHLFTLGGLVPLLKPGGKECQRGIANTETSFSAVDILINVGLGAAGFVAGAFACNSDPAS